MIRGDITVNWDTSPRIVLVSAPSTDLVIQDLVDTIRSMEAEQQNMIYPSLLAATGKDALGTDIYTGITATLQNAQIGFDGRAATAPALCNISGGNLIAVDANGDFLDELYFTPNVNIRNQMSTSPALVEIDTSGSDDDSGSDFGTIG